MKEGIIFEIDHLTAVIMTNEGEFLSLSAKPSWQKGNLVKFSELEVISNRKRERTPWMKRKVLIALIASVFFLFIPLSIPSQASTYITLDINPSLEMEIKGDSVKYIRPLNDDAALILANLPELEVKLDVYQMTELIISAAKKLGYLKEEEKNYIMVGVIDEKEFFKNEQYEAFIQEQLNEEKLEADIIILDGTKEEKKTAEQKGISYGKYLLQQNQKKEGIEISDEELMKQSVKEIFEEIKDKKKEDRNDDNNKDKENNNQDEKDRISDNKKQNQDKSREDQKNHSDNNKSATEEKNEKENEDQKPSSDDKGNDPNPDNHEKGKQNENESTKDNSEKENKKENKYNEDKDHDSDDDEDNDNDDNDGNNEKEDEGKNSGEENDNENDQDR